VQGNVHYLHGWVDKPKQIFMFRDLGEEGEYTKCPAGKIALLICSISEQVLIGKLCFSRNVYKNTNIKVTRKEL
jgi:hypothetical protein